jgi:hypothetical protein
VKRQVPGQATSTPTTPAQTTSTTSAQNPPVPVNPLQSTFLYDCWKYVKDYMEQQPPSGVLPNIAAPLVHPVGFVLTERYGEFPLDFHDAGTTDLWATDEYYGCPVVVLITPHYLFIYHFVQTPGSAIAPMDNYQNTQRVFINLLDDALRKNGHFPEVDLEPNLCRNDWYVLITAPQQDTNDETNGVLAFREFFTENLGVPPANLHYIQYSQTQGVAWMGLTTQPDYRGFSLIEWTSFGPLIGGVLTVYLGNETPRLSVYYDKDWKTAPGGATFGVSGVTTDGNGQRV